MSWPPTSIPGHSDKTTSRSGRAFLGIPSLQPFLPMEVDQPYLQNGKTELDPRRGPWLPQHQKTAKGKGPEKHSGVPLLPKATLSPSWLSAFSTELTWLDSSPQPPLFQMSSLIGEWGGGSLLFVLPSVGLQNGNVRTLNLRMHHCITFKKLPKMLIATFKQMQKCVKKPSSPLSPNHLAAPSRGGPP